MDNLTKQLLDLKVEIEDKAIRDSAKLIKAYKNSLHRIRKEISDIYMSYDVAGEIKIGQSQRYSVLSQLEKELIKQAKQLGVEDVGTTTDILTNVYKESYYKTAYILEQGVSIGANFSILRPEFIQTAVNMPIEGKMFSDRIWTNKAKLVTRVRSSVEQAMIEGKDIRKLAREVSRDFGSSIYDSNRLIQTETARCHTEAQEQIYEDSGLVNRVLWSSVLEENTCEICAGYDGQEFDMNDSSKPDIPEHPLCRCVWIPVVDGWNPTKRRDQSSGDIIEYKNFNQWAKDKGIGD